MLHPFFLLFTAENTVTPLFRSSVLLPLLALLVGACSDEFLEQPVEPSQPQAEEATLGEPSGEEIVGEEATLGELSDIAIKSGRRRSGCRRGAASCPKPAPYNPSAVNYPNAPDYHIWHSREGLCVGQSVPVPSRVGGPGGSLVMQNDGNLVMYRAGVAVWATETGGKRVGGQLGQCVVMQIDGNLVMYTAGGKPVWHTGTHNYLQAVALFSYDTRPGWPCKRRGRWPGMLVVVQDATTRYDSRCAQ